MKASQAPAYGFWSAVIINSLVFTIFAFSFAKPQSKRDWRSFGAFSAFLVALFTEMYGYPLTIYLLSGWLSARYPGIDYLSHDAGHLLETLVGWRSNPHPGPFHLLSGVFIVGGFWLLSAAWRVLSETQQSKRLANSGVYRRVRHPQYIGFVLILFGFLLQWPTLLTMAMFPVLVFMYARLAKREEVEMLARFGDEFRRYRAAVPAYIPRWNDIRMKTFIAALVGALLALMLAFPMSSIAAPDEAQKAMIQRAQEAKNKLAAAQVARGAERQKVMHEHMAMMDQMMAQMARAEPRAGTRGDARMDRRAY
jgi:protein-S-isoprenylcysteine O-methyltransferase Ste14